jgi:di/tricarboxylate transporter
MNLPDPHAIAALALTLAALYLFSREQLPVQTTSLVVLALLTIGFSAFPYVPRTAAGALPDSGQPGEPLDPVSFFLGFGNEALIAICALVIASQGLVRTGALAPLGRIVARVWSVSPQLALGVMLVMTAALSAFMNNTPQVVLMIPILMSVALRSGTPVSATLMPMTFASQIGGMATPIGTSLNLLVISSAASLGVQRFGMFDFIAPAAIAGAIGIAYLWLVAPRLLPARQANLDVSPRVFTAQMSIPAESPLVGTRLGEVLAKTENEMQVRRVLRAPGLALAPLPDLAIEGGDQLLVRDTSSRLMEFARLLGATLYSGEAAVDEQHPLKADDQQTAEIVVTEASPLNQRTLAHVDFDERYQFIPLAIHREGQPLEAERRARLRDERLRTGDVLLIQGPADQIAALKKSRELLVLDSTADVPHTRLAPLALAIMGAIVVVASLRIAPIAIAAVCGAALMFVTGCLRWRDATRALSSSMIMLTVASLALSHALVQTGGAAFLAGLLTGASASLPPVAVMSGLMLVMAVLSNMVSNTAAAVIGTPIAVELARQLGVAPEPFVLAVLFGVNMGFATPVADNCNLLVYSAGGYSFRDFVRVGVPLTIIMWLALTWLLPRYYPLA